ncbi:MAG: helix-turn-helix transcriptional regulator [Erysipelothrix sp.]|jgi:ribosome-binding protein aMBF1 (putative translation factor)|nr:helix-turn-helix transcriptional regulator [Erysipelothrix sp.]
MKTWNQYKDYVKSVDNNTKKEIEEIEIFASIVSEMIARRHFLGLTQRDLSTLCGIPQSSLARIETFRIVPKIDTLLKIMKPLGLKLSVINSEQA